MDLVTVFLFWRRWMGRRILLYDTTLRDGSQGEDVSFSVEDKVKIAKKLDEMGFHYLEGGWPGSNPKDARFFKTMAFGSPLRFTKIAAFGSTHKKGLSPDEDPNLIALLETGVKVVTIFGKSWDLHATQILETTPEENRELISDTVSFLKSKGLEVIYDAEHFFDGYKRNQAYAISTIEAAARSGADYVVLCDTNGGTLPHEVQEIVSQVRKLIHLPLGIHAHNDCGLAVANSISAVRAGVEMVQGTINGYGERCGNADLVTLIGVLQLKMGYECIPEEMLGKLSNLSKFVNEVANLSPSKNQPFVGKSAFAHKGGVHVSAVLKNPAAYEHIPPEKVGNVRRVLVSDLSGKGNVLYKAGELGIELNKYDVQVQEVVKKIKELEDKGYQFEAAEGSLELLIRKTLGEFQEPFGLEAFRVTIEKDKNKDSTSHATIKVSVGTDEEITAAEGDGPVNALDNALRKALSRFYPQVQNMKLVDFKVRVINGDKGTAARVLVLIDSSDGEDVWTTVGASENVIEASWHALVDSVQYKLLKDKKMEGTQKGLDKKGVTAADLGMEHGLRRGLSL